MKLSELLTIKDPAKKMRLRGQLSIVASLIALLLAVGSGFFMEDLMGIATASKKEERFFSGLVPMMSAVFFFIAFSYFMLGALMLGPKK